MAHALVPPGNQIVGVFQGGCVEFHEMGLASVFAQGGFERPASLGVTVGKDDIRALGDETLADALAYSRRGARDQRVLVLQKHVACLLLTTSMGGVPESTTTVRRTDRKSTRLNSSH